MRFLFTAGLFLLLMLASCVTILQALVTHDNIITDDRFTGEWIGTDSKITLIQKMMDSKLGPDLLKESNKQNISKEDLVFYKKLYVISFHEDSLNYTWIGGIVKINDQYYLNFSAEECLDNLNNDAYGLGGLQNTSSIAKLEWKSDTLLSVNFLNGDKIKEIILNGNARISYEYDPLFDTFVITATSKELEDFLKKYGSNEGLYKGGNMISLVRKK